MMPSGRRPPTPRVAEAVRHLRGGRLVILTHHDASSPAGNLIAPAALLDTATMAFMIRHTSGFVAVAMDGARLDQLGVPPMVADRQNPGDAEFAVTVDATEGVTSGISAHDRAVTARQLASPAATSDDFTRPGHVVMLRTRAGGVLARAASAEAAVDLCDLADLPPVAVIADLVADTGEMADRHDLLRLASRNGLASVSVDDMVATRHRFEQHAHRLHSVRVSGGAVPVDVHTYRYDLDGSDYLVLVHGDMRDGTNVSVQMSSTRTGGERRAIPSPVLPDGERPLSRSSSSQSQVEAIAHILRDLKVHGVELEQEDGLLHRALTMCGVEVHRSPLAELGVRTRAPGEAPDRGGHSPLLVEVHS